MLKDTTKDIIAKLEELEKEEKQLFSNMTNELGIKMDTLQTDQQQMQSKIDTLHLQQNKTTASDIAGIIALLYNEHKICFKQK